MKKNNIISICILFIGLLIGGLLIYEGANINNYRDAKELEVLKEELIISKEELEQKIEPIKAEIKALNTQTDIKYLTPEYRKVQKKINKLEKSIEKDEKSIEAITYALDDSLDYCNFRTVRNNVYTKQYCSLNTSYSNKDIFYVSAIVIISASVIISTFIFVVTNKKTLFKKKEPDNLNNNNDKIIKHKKIIILCVILFIIILILDIFVLFPFENSDILTINVDGKPYTMKKNDFVEIDGAPYGHTMINDEYLNDIDTYLYKNITMDSTLYDVINAYDLKMYNTLTTYEDYDPILAEDSSINARGFYKKLCEAEDGWCDAIFGYEKIGNSWKRIRRTRLKRIIKQNDYMVAELGDYPSNVIIYEISFSQGKVSNISIIRK